VRRRCEGPRRNSAEKTARGCNPPLIAKSDNDAQPVLTVALSGERTLRELTELADKVVKVRLERSNGVGDVQLVGGLNRAMNVWVEADRLEAYRVRLRSCAMPSSGKTPILPAAT